MACGMVYLHIHIRFFSDNFSYGMKMSSSFFVLFGVVFLLQPCNMGDFGC